MEARSTRKPLVSVMLPLASDADPELLDICLKSISSQTYREFEVLVLLSDGSPSDLERILQGFSFVRIFSGSFTKSAARNFLAQQSTGTYMLYIDVDMELNEKLLEECIDLASEKGSQAIITALKEAPTRNFWGKCRSLEWELLSGDIGAASPYFLLSSTFMEVGGFDESLDMWDDWALTLELMANGIDFDRVGSAILIRDTTNLVEMFIRKYKRGRFIPVLLKKYPDAPHVRFFDRFIRIYVKNWRALIRSPFLTFGLFFLKSVDIVALYVGRLNPIKEIPSNGTQPYFQNEIARSYDKVRLTDGFNLYKHFSEINALKQLIGHVNGPLIEVGCGTGRITLELIKNGITILPTDPSPAMLKEFRRKTGLPNPIMANGMALPFIADVVEGAFSLRVIWHLPTLGDLKQMIEEMSRISLDFVIVDISNERRWSHPVFRLLAAIYFRLNPLEQGFHETSQFLTLEALACLVEQLGLHIDQLLALDVLSPVWLRLLPVGAAKPLFPIISYLETTFSRLIPPGRFLIRLAKTSDGGTGISD